MRISDWSSDVCSSDLVRRRCADRHDREGRGEVRGVRGHANVGPAGRCATRYGGHEPCARMRRDFAENALIEALRVRAMDKRLLDILVCTVTKRSEEHTSELQSLMPHSYAEYCLQKKTTKENHK